MLQDNAGPQQRAEHPGGTDRGVARSGRASGQAGVQSNHGAEPPRRAWSPAAPSIFPLPKQREMDCFFPLVKGREKGGGGMRTRALEMWPIRKHNHGNSVSGACFEPKHFSQERRVHCAGSAQSQKERAMQQPCNFGKESLNPFMESFHLKNEG